MVCCSYIFTTLVRQSVFYHEMNPDARISLLLRLYASISIIWIRYFHFVYCRYPLFYTQNFKCNKSERLFFIEVNMITNLWQYAIIFFLNITFAYLFICKVWKDGITNIFFICVMIFLLQNFVTIFKFADVLIVYLNLKPSLEQGF